MNNESDIFLVIHEDTAIYSLIGRITAARASVLVTSCEKLPSQVRFLVFDLQNCSYIDSTTIGSFLKISRFMNERNGKLFLRHPSEEITAILDDMRLTRFFFILDETTDPQLEKEIKELLETIPEESRIPLPYDERDVLDEAFILEAHRDIVDTAPHLKPEFEHLIELLEKTVQD
ncbi:MAG: STAS domain-containing protein [Spirochaetales bacterium]|nr:STAS domain-containing protein [Spirochaetales bacterium]MCF7937559.1 STAS domain-containing protein [Spirochaetales bacterium]